MKDHDQSILWQDRGFMAPQSWNSNWMNMMFLKDFLLMQKETKCVKGFQLNKRRNISLAISEKKFMKSYRDLLTWKILPHISMTFLQSNQKKFFRETSLATLMIKDCNHCQKKLIWGLSSLNHWENQVRIQIILSKVNKYPNLHL